MNKITIIGCGPGSPELLTQAAVNAAREADYIVGSKRLLNMIGETNAVTLDSGANVEAAIGFIEENREAGKVAVLVSGDPGIFSLSKSVVERFGMDSCSVIPGISSTQAAFAALGLTWNDAMIISAHAKNPKFENGRAGSCNKFAVLLGTDRSVAWAASFADGLEGEWQVYLCENISLENEKITRTTIQELGGAEVSSMAIAVLVKEEQLN